MKVVLSPEATERLEAQIAYLSDVGATAAAERLHARVLSFLLNHLARFPRTGRRLEDRDLWEMSIPRTRLVLWYRIEVDRIEIATVWHTSQDRLSAPKR
ncbi:MAG: type II toxin-antitoxin system RelE/ParE family toxin [Solimonas sp.]